VFNEGLNVLSIDIEKLIWHTMDFDVSRALAYCLGADLQRPSGSDFLPGYGEQSWGYWRLLHRRCYTHMRFVER
jgi:hypothetical protein